MTTNTIMQKKIMKQRLTAFIDPLIIKRAKIRGALEDLTISEVVEQALDAYAPKLETDSDQHINVKFSKHTKALVVPR